MKKDMNQLLAETAIRRTIKNIKDSPERAIRNLVDLGLHFSNGRFQTHLLKTAQKMLQNPQSAYYTLVRDAVAAIDPDILITFSVNLGYNGCTKGAELIRKIEAEQKFNIPWALNLAINKKELESNPQFYPDVIRQGVSLGIHTYLLFITQFSEALIPMMQSRQDCAFILFLDSSQVNEFFLTKMESVKNAMIAVSMKEDALQACQRLHDSHLLYAVYQHYMEKDKSYLINGGWLASVLPLRPVFAFLQADLTCSPLTQKEVYDYIISVRDSQQVPLILMDMKQDILMIDQVVSDDVCMVGFDSDGNLKTHEGLIRDEKYNIFCHPLKEILMAAAPK